MEALDPPLFSLYDAIRERREDSRYFWDNRKRSQTPIACVVQRTRSGKGFIEADDVRYEVPSGSAMFFQHGDNSFYGYPEEATEAYDLEYIVISGASVADLFGALIFSVGRVVSMPEGSEAQRLLHALIDRQQRSAQGDRYQESARIYEFLMACFRLSAPIRTRDDAVWQAREYILSHFQQPFSQQELADRMGLSREHLARRFKAVYGESPGRFCAQIRMARAYELLQVTSGPIEQVALQCGYADLTSFGRCFRMKYGISPGQFRARSQRG